jgi:hypothetical protein
MDSLLLYSKLSVLPEKMKEQVADFIDFLIQKARDEDGLVARQVSDPVVINSILELESV